MRVFKIQRLRQDCDGGFWYDVPFAAGSKSYCNGYLDAMDSLYPSPPYRMGYIADSKWNTVRETSGREAVHTNSH